MQDLPHLYTQTRSGRKSQLPMRIRGTVFFCIEFPSGVYIDYDGIPRPGDSGQFKIPAEKMVNDVSNMPKREYRNSLYDIQRHNENSEYYTCLR